MRVFKTLIGRTLGATLMVLGLCLFALLYFANAAISDRNDAIFDQNARIFTSFLAQQINTGTRLKREAMIAPQLEAAFTNEELAVSALRVTHIDGVEVINMSATDVDSGSLPAFGPATFSDTVTATNYSTFKIVHAPIILGTGADATLVGEIQVIWDKSGYIAATNALLGMLRTAFLVTMVVVAISIGATLTVFVSRPLKQTIGALRDVSSGKDIVTLPKSQTLEVRQMVESMEVFLAVTRERAQQLAEISEILELSQAGDFSGRVQIEGDVHDDRNRLRVMVNGLLSTVDTGLTETLRVLDRLADKDLTEQMQGQFRGAFALLQENVNKSAQSLNATLGGIVGHADTVKEAATVLANSSDELANRTQRNAATLEETSAAISAVSETLRASASLSTDAKEMSDEASQQAARSRKVIEELVDAMQSIHKYSNDIADIITLIDDVAFQTNLLALNAGVEAARAGEHGRGFAVVASEVRGLAQRTSESAAEVKKLIEGSATEVKSGVNRVDVAGDAIAELVAAIEKVSVCISDISSGAQEQSLSVAEISNALHQLDQNTQRNAAMVEETTQQTRQLNDGAQATQQLLSEFSVNRNYQPATTAKAS